MDASAPAILEIGVVLVAAANRSRVDEAADRDEEEDGEDVRNGSRRSRAAAVTGALPIASPPTKAASVIALVPLLNGGTIFAIVRRLRLPGVAPWQVGAGLVQIGEFSFVLASVGATRGWITPHVYTAILGAVVASIAVVTITVRRHAWWPGTPVP